MKNNNTPAPLQPAFFTKWGFQFICTFIVLALLGSLFLPLLPLKLSPSDTLPQARINFVMPNNSSRVIESSVTSKIESMLGRIKGLRKITSKSGNGWGNIQIEIDKYSDPEVVRFEISNTIRQLWPTLPDGVSYPQLSMKSANDQYKKTFMTFTVNAPANPRYITQYAENNIKSRLINCKGLNQVTLNGAMPMEWQLEMRATQLDLLDVNAEMILSAIRTHLRTEFLGINSLSDSSNSFIRVLLQNKLMEKGEPNWSQIQVCNKQGSVFTLTDLVKITRCEQAPTSYYRINGLNSIYLNLEADPLANQLNLGKTVNTEIENIRQHLPPGFEIHKIYDATTYIQDELSKIYFRSGLSILFLLLFIFIVSRSLHYLLLIIISLMINLSIALLFYYFLKITLQIYSLASITISVTLLIDNIIVMADHIIKRRNMQAFPAILAATLTTVAAISMVFFTNETIKLNLQDFAFVVITNLSVSLLIALFLVPALVHRLGLLNKTQTAKIIWNRKRRAVKATQFYGKILAVLIRSKILFFSICILAFGLPVFKLPEKIDSQHISAKWYNTVFGSAIYRDHFKQPIDVVLGGTLRLFVKHVYDGSYLTDKNELQLHISANAPNGSTLAQTNQLVKIMEQYLSGFPEIKQYETHIYNAQQAYISIHFHNQFVNSGFPYTLNGLLVNKAIELGGASWSVYGLPNQGFSNNMKKTAGTFQVAMNGFNYDELYQWANQLKDTLQVNRRIKEVNLSSEFSWYKEDYQEYIFQLIPEQLSNKQLHVTDIYNSLHSNRANNLYVTEMLYKNHYEQLRLKASESYELDIWNFKNTLLKIGEQQVRLNEIAEMQKQATPQNIVRINQQYQVCLQYKYIGAYEQGVKNLTAVVDQFQKKLPLGYSVKNEMRTNNWSQQDNSNYYYLLLIMVIIVFICSILFNSIRQAFIIIAVIPISYIGVFLTFYLFSINFDQGGYTSLIILCGITINASIYILNEWNNIRKRLPNITPLAAYLSACNVKLLPILTTSLTTVIGFIPFLIQPESFWFPFAAGTVGGVILSLMAIFILLPLLICKIKKTSRNNS